MKKMLIIASLIGLVATSCSTKILLPYEENALCNKGKYGGYCGSLSDVYEYIEDREVGEIE